MTHRACMGGWCGRRNSCPHYVDGNRRDPFPAERLCEIGHDGTPKQEVAHTVKVSYVGRSLALQRSPT